MLGTGEEMIGCYDNLRMCTRQRVFVMVALDRVYRDTPYFCTTHAEHFTLAESRNELCSANQLPVLISLYLRLWIGGVCGKSKGAGNQRR